MIRREPLQKGYTYFVGIDVSKNKLNYAVQKERIFIFDYESENSLAGFADFQQELRSATDFKPRRVLYGLEHTGIYGKKIIQALSNQHFHFAVLHPLQIKMSLGILRGKNDKVDARRISTYLCLNHHHLPLFCLRRSIIYQLTTLRLIRQQLMSVRTRLSVAHKEECEFASPGCEDLFASGIKQTLKAVETEFKNAEDKIDNLLKKDSKINRLLEIITSVPGVGQITAIAIIIATNEFLLISDPKKFACYCGVAPFERSSGKSTRNARVSRSANIKLKTLMQTCAISALKSSPEIKSYFERKKAEGKPSMSIYNAIRNKLIHRIFACVKADRLYQPGYRYEVSE